MKFTIFGAAGYVGRHLLAALQAAGHEVHAHPRDSMQSLERPLGHVLYCIGLTSDFRTRAYDTMRAHVSLLTEILANADFDSLLYLSSTRVYARSSVGSEQTTLAVDVTDPSELYSISKLAGESLCRACGRTGVRVARISNIVGYDPDSQNFLPSLIRAALAGRIVLQSDPASAKDYVLLDDVIALLPKIATQGHDWIYNIASGTNVRNSEIANRLVALTGCELALQPASPRSTFPPIDVTRIRAEFNFSPAQALEALPSLVAAYRDSKANRQ